MCDIGIVEDASVFVEDGLIRWVGPANDFSAKLTDDATIFDASAYVALPGFVDAHTHMLFAGSREDEFAKRSQGISYQQIAAEGGGILSTVRATRAASKKELKKAAARRLDQMMKHGTTTVEIKSGYGLNEETEIKMLEAIRELADEQLMTIVPTFLGAHAIPPEYARQREAYIELICDRMLPSIARRKLARFCDVFCEDRYFAVSEARLILEKALALGLEPKLHADEFAAIGGTALAATLNAASVDHLEHITPEGIEALKKSDTVPVLLPGVSFCLRNPYAPARRLIDAGLAVAIATDFNPGSCMSFSMPLMMTIACTQMGMTPDEAITATTLNAAAALGISSKVGSIEVGKEGDIVLYDIPNYRFLAYHFGVNHVAQVIKHGVMLEFP
jgi:imidazolonepropionase